MSSSMVVNFAVEQRIQEFFTGGQIAVTKDLSHIFAPCGFAVSVVNAQTGMMESKLSVEEESEVTSICLSPEERHLVVAYRNLLLRQFSWKDTGVIRTWKSGHRAPILRMLYDSEDGLILATGSADFSVKIWDLEKRYCTHTLRGSAGVVSCLEFGRGEEGQRILYVGSAEGEIRVWDLSESAKSHRCLAQVQAGNGNAVISLIIYGNQLISADKNKSIIVWNRKTYKRIKTIGTEEALEWLIPAIDNDVKVLKRNRGKHSLLLLGGGEMGEVKLWDLAEGALVWRSPKSSLFGGSAHLDQIIPCPAANAYCLTTVEHNIIILDGSSLAGKSQLIGFNDEILSVGLVGADNKYFVVGTNSADVRLYKASNLSGRLLHGHTDHVMSVASCTCDPDVFATCSRDATIRLWRLSDETEGSAVCFGTGTGHTASVTGLRFSRTTFTFLASVSRDKTLKLWGFGERMKAWVTVVAHEKEVTCVDVSPNDRLIATGSLDKTVAIWRVRKERSEYSLESAGRIVGNKRGVWDVCFSPVDQAVAAACGDCSVNIFSLSDFSCVKSLQGHNSAVLQVKFLPTGQQLVSGDSGGLVKLWNLKTSECTKTYDAHQEKVWALSLAPDGETMVTGGGDGRLLIWNDVTKAEKDAEIMHKVEQSEKEQQLANLLQQRQFAKALALAVQLKRPLNAFRVITEIIATNTEALKTSLELLKPDEISVLLGYVVEWNTNSRNCLTAQMVLGEVLRLYKPEQLLHFPNIKETVEALLPYTERHFDRFSKMKQSSKFLDYTWKCSRLSGDFDEL